MEDAGPKIALDKIAVFDELHVKHLSKRLKKIGLRTDFERLTLRTVPIALG
jgi:hypothetical protein